MSRKVIFVPDDYWTTPPEENPVPITNPAEYERLVAFTRLLWDTAEMLRVKGRAEAADIVHAEVVHFAAERDIARTVAELDADASNPITTMDLGELSDD